MVDCKKDFEREKYIAYLNFFNYLTSIIVEICIFIRIVEGVINMFDAIIIKMCFMP